MTTIYIPRSLAAVATSEPGFVRKALFIGLTPMMINRYVNDRSEASADRKRQICEDADALGFADAPVEYIQL